MNSLLVCVNAILPVFLMMAVGYLAKRVGLIREEQVSGMNAVAFKVFMPLMNFYNIYSSDLSSSLRPKLMLFAAAGILAMFFLALPTSRLLIPQKESRSAAAQALFRTNHLILGIPVAASLVPNGNMGVVSVMAAVTAPLFNILAVITLERGGKKVDRKKLVRDILLNPLVTSSVAGVLFLLLGVRLPTPVNSALRDMGRVASPLMLFLLGAFFRFRGFRGQGRALAVVCLGRLVVFPALGLACAVLLGFRGMEFAALLTLFASSTSVSSFTMVQQMGGDAALAGNAVVMTSLFCSLTLFGWSFLFKVLGFF